MILKITNRKGFTLVETLVAIAILLLGIVAASTAAQSGLSSTKTVRERIAAMFLAQEAVEGVKNIKDSNLVSIGLGNTLGWLDGIIGPCPSGSVQPCAYDIIGGSGQTGGLFACSGTSCAVKLDDISGVEMYRQMNSSGEDTGFTREIFIEETVPNVEAKVRVRVSKPGGSSDFEVTSYIYNWF